ncbi:MAG: hypothetical protein LBD65_02430, partial [Spirochaetaceae bacterium]|nr:hypothetical protein [Spirochaetaceae bacterium]
MPSLQQLKEFKLSFLDIGREGAAPLEQNLPGNDLPLPDSEPLAPPPPAETANSETADGETADGETLPAFGDEEFDFGSFLDTIPDDLSVPDPGLPDIPEAAGDAPVPPDDGGIPPLTEDEFTAPDTLLRGLDDAESPGAASEDFPEDLDFSSASDFGEDFLTNPAPEDEAAPLGDDVPFPEDFGDFSVPDAEPGEDAEMPPDTLPDIEEPSGVSPPGDEPGAPSPDDILE